MQSYDHGCHFHPLHAGAVVPPPCHPAGRIGRLCLRPAIALVALGLALGLGTWGDGRSRARPDARSAAMAAPVAELKVYLPTVQHSHTLPGRHGNVDAVLTAQMGGLMGPFDVQGDYAYTFVGSAFVVVDLSDPKQPREVGRVQAHRRAYALDVVGDTAYLVRDHHLWAIDVSDPARPVQLGEQDLRWRCGPYSDARCQQGKSLSDIVVVGVLAYVADGNGTGAQVLDVSDPVRPAWVGRFCSGDAYDVVVAGSTAYVTNNDGPVCIADIADPARPVLLGTVPSSDSKKVEVAGHIAYVLGERDDFSPSEFDVGLWVVDVADPSKPATLGFYAVSAVTLHVDDGFAYLGLSRGGVQVLDVSVPGVIRLVQTISTTLLPSFTPWPSPWSEFAPEMRRAGDKAVLLDPWGGLAVYNRPSPDSLEHRGDYRPPFCVAGQVVAGGNRVHVVEAGTGIHIVDATETAHPTVVGRYGVPESLRLALKGTMAYVASGREGLRVFDVSQPTAPVQVAALMDPVHAPPGTNGLEVLDVAVLGGHAFLATGQHGLWVVDVADPSMPKVVSRVTDMDARRVAVDGGTVYATDLTGLSVVDVTDPLLPRRTGFVQTDFEVWHDQPLAVGEGFVAVAGGYLRIVDVADPTSPRPVTRNDSYHVADLAIAGPYLFQGGRTFDVSAPFTPRLVGAITGPGEGSSGIALVGRTLYMGAGGLGLVVHELSFADSSFMGVD